MKIIQSTHTYNYKHAQFSREEFRFVKEITQLVVKYNDEQKTLPPYAQHPIFTGEFTSGHSNEFTWKHHRNDIFHGEDKRSVDVMRGIFDMVSANPSCVSRGEYASTRSVSRAGEVKNKFDLAREAISRAAVEMYEDLEDAPVLQSPAFYADISQQYISRVLHPSLEISGSCSEHTE